MRAITDILVADDSDHDAELTLYALRRSAPGQRILRVLDGEQALQFLFARDGYADRPPGLPQLLLLDLEMPAVDGFGVLEAIRAHPYTEMLRVVVWTSSSNPLAMSKAIELGANDYRGKPVMLDSYCNEIDRIVQIWLPDPVAAAGVGYATHA